MHDVGLMAEEERLRARSRLTLFGEHEEKVIEQGVNCLLAEEGSFGGICADGHFGYSQPVGMYHALREHISVSGVGYDIGCGNKAVRTNIEFADIEGEVDEIMDEIFSRISFGMGMKNDEQVDHQVIEEIAEAHVPEQREMLDLARKQLGTVGGGNHYVDLFRDENGMVWIGVHFGSRGFGHKTASGFMRLARGMEFFDRKNPEGEMMSPPILLRTDTDLGQSYISAMTLAGHYAYAGRDVVVDRVLEILGGESNYEVHNHHNFAWQEEHGGEDLWVVRKGCTPAWPGQEGFVGATMGEQSVILEGADHQLSSAACYSTVHGAGRAMSRTQAAGRRKKRWSCSNRDCDWRQLPRTHRPEDGRCPDCGNEKLTKRWVQEQEGEIDWPATREELAKKNIVLRGAAADEAPGAYKRLSDVLEAQGPTVNIIHRLTPIGVAMAPPDVHDPFKD